MYVVISQCIFQTLGTTVVRNRLELSQEQYSAEKNIKICLMFVLKKDMFKMGM